MHRRGAVYYPPHDDKAPFCFKILSSNIMSKVLYALPSTRAGKRGPNSYSDVSDIK